MIPAYCAGMGLVLLLFQVPSRRYWLVSVDSVQYTKHTHVHIRGRVTLVRHEQDGDTHYKVIGRKSFVVLECIPILPCPDVKVGTTVDAYGISRYDKEHQWYEIHPVERLTSEQPSR